MEDETRSKIIPLPMRSRDPTFDPLAYVRDAISTMRHGEIRIVMHDGSVARIEKTDKLLCK